MRKKAAVYAGVADGRSRSAVDARDASVTLRLPRTVRRRSTTATEDGFHVGIGSTDSCAGPDHPALGPLSVDIFPAPAA